MKKYFELIPNQRQFVLSLLLSLIIIFVTQSCKSPTASKQNTTPDTTSNNFTFQTFTFGADNAGSSHLQDVAIVSDSDIWCVGAIYLDSANGAPDPNAYNAVHWDGSKWELKKIYYFGNCSAVKYPPLKAIYIFPDNKIAVTNGGSIGWINGDSVYMDCGVISLLNGAINKIWGISGNDFYVVGNAGSIAHYQNGNWQKIESGTNMNIYDIWGAINPQTGKIEILAVASYPDTSAQRKIFQINGTSATEISSKGINWDLVSVWFKPSSQYFVAGSGIYNKNFLSDNTWSSQYFNVTNYYINCIRGNDINDVVAVGSYGEVIQYNGLRWKSFRDQTGLVNEEYLSLAIKGNEIVAVGYNGQRAVIAVGKR